MRIIGIGVLLFFIRMSLQVDPTCRPGDPNCSAFYGPPQDTTPAMVLILTDTTQSANKKLILLPDAIENSTSPDVEFRIFQQKVLNFTELGALKVLDSQTLSSVGAWAVRLDPASPWLNSSSSNLQLGEFSSVRLQNIKNPGLAQLSLITTKEGQNAMQQTVVLYKFVMPLPIAARLQLKVEPAKIFSLTSPSDAVNTPFVMVQDIFTVTQGPMVANNVVQDANNSFSALPQSKTLEKKVVDFLNTASVIPKNLDPGVYLKPKAGYGLIATLEFQLYGDAGNSTKILYEQGDVYLHLKDRLRFVPKAPPPPSPAMAPPSGDLEFYIRCWDGTAPAETALGPSGDLRINFDNFFGRRPQLKPNATAVLPGGQLPKVIGTVPYALDLDAQYQTGISVGDLADWFFTASGQNGNVPDWQPWTMGIGILAAGSGDLGDWQYKNSGGWHNFPDNLKIGWKLFGADQQNQRATNGGYATTFSVADLTERTHTQVVLVSPKLTIRFKPTNNQSFWSAADAFRQASLTFLAWKPTNSNVAGDTMAVDLDLPNCVVCNDVGISRDGVTICAERYGCDGKASSMAQKDQCDVCGGSNECLDCRHIPNGKAQWICNVCTEDGSMLKDCRGICNGTYQKTSTGECIDSLNGPKGCDGEYHSSATVNDCGICVLGRTGRPLNYSIDQCGVCNGTNACVGCDGQLNSGKQLDLCGMCRHPKDDNFNKGCGARMSDVHPKVASIVNGTIRVNATGLSSATKVECWLTLLATFSNTGSGNTAAPSANVTVNVTASVTAVNSAGDMSTLTLHWDYMDAPGVYTLKCKADQTFDIAAAGNGSAIYLVDYNVLQLSAVNPNSLVLGSGNQAMLVQITGTFIPALTQESYCLAQNKMTRENLTFPAEVRSATEASCNLSSVARSGALDLRVVQHPDQLLDVIMRQRPVTVTVKAKAPKILFAKFGDAALEIIVGFDVNSVANGDCQQILDDAVVAKLGNQPSCKFSADQLHITLGSNHQVSVNDTIKFKSNSVHQVDAEFYDYLPSDASAVVGAPDRKLIPAISVDPVVTVSMCAGQVRLSVIKASGDGGRAMTYQWTILKVETLDRPVGTPRLIGASISGTSTQSATLVPSELQQLTQSAQSDTLVIPLNILTSDNTYTFNIIACNFLKDCSASAQTKLNVGNYTDSQLVVQIHGLDPPLRCGYRRNLKADAVLKICGVAKPLTSGLMFHWEASINQTIIATGNDWTFVLPANDVEYGQLGKVKAQAFYDDPNGNNFTADTALTFTYEPQRLWVRLGATTRRQGAAEDLVLDGSASSNPNKKVQNLQHSWTCARLDPKAPNDPSRAGPCYIKSNSSSSLLFEEKFNLDKAVISVPANTLDTGVYNFTDTVRSGELQDNDTVMVTLVPGRVPLVKMLPSLGQKPSIEEPITFLANVYSMENVTVTISFLETQGYGNITLPEELHRQTTVSIPASAIGPDGYIFSFTLPPAQTAQYPNWAGLAPETLYAARISANTSSGLLGESFVSFRTNNPPTMGNLAMTTIPADSTISALKTVLRLEAKGFVDHAEDLPLSYQFGIRSHLADGMTKDEWFPASSVEEFNTYLPSAESSHPICKRVGYQALVKVCDFHGACAKTISPSQPFQVQQPENVTAAIDDLMQEVQVDLADGNGFGAWLKMAAVVAQKCGNLSRSSEGATQAVAAHVLGRVTQTSDKEDLVTAARVANELLLRPNATVPDGILTKLRQVVQGIEKAIGMAESKNMTAATVGKRRKRQVTTPASQPQVDADSATQLLGAYELIVIHATDSNSVVTYLKGTQDLLTQMCLSRDATQPPMIASSKGTSQPLCTVEAQGLFIDPSIVSKNISIAALDQKSAAQFQIGSSLEETYTLWSCNKGRSTCTSVCLATAVYFATNEEATPVGQYMFQNGSAVALSDVHFAQFIDPISKEILAIKKPDWERYTLLIPLVRAGSTSYYACKMYLLTGQAWTSNQCDTIGVKTMSTGKKYVGCQCRAFGYVAVFEAQLPAASVFGPNKPLAASFLLGNVDSSKYPSKEDQINVTRQWMADLMNTSTKRIVEFEIKRPSVDAFGAGSAPEMEISISFVLRPPSRFDWTETSQLIWKINNKTNDQVTSGNAATSWQIVPQSLTYSPVKRDLKNDFNSRLVTIKCLNDYDDTVTRSGAAALASTLTAQLSSATTVSRARITDMGFAKGSTILSFIIQSLGPKSMEISAEEAALILIDQIRYEELILMDVGGNMLIVDPNGTTVQEVERKLALASNDSLPVIIGGTVGAAFFVVIAFVIALVAIKKRGRTDKVSPLTTPSSSNRSPNDSQRNSAQTTVHTKTGPA